MEGKVKVFHIAKTKRCDDLSIRVRRVGEAVVGLGK